MKLSVLPESSRVDEPVRISVSGLAPSTVVTIEVRVRDGGLQEWASQAEFRSDADGIVDASEQAPLSGSYSGVDGDGLLWSMTPVGTRRPVFFARRQPRPLAYTAVAAVGGEVVATREFSRT